MTFTTPIHTLDESLDLAIEGLKAMEWSGKVEELEFVLNDDSYLILLFQADPSLLLKITDF